MLEPQYIKITVFDQSTKKARLFSIANNMKLSQLRQLIQKQWQVKQFKFINDGTVYSKSTQKHTPVAMCMKAYYLITIMTQVREQPKKQSKIIEKQSKRLTQSSSVAQRHIANTRQFLQKQRINQQKQQRLLYNEQQLQRLAMLTHINTNNNTNNNINNTNNNNNFNNINNSNNNTNNNNNSHTMVQNAMDNKNNNSDNKTELITPNRCSFKINDQQQTFVNTNNNIHNANKMSSSLTQQQQQELQKQQLLSMSRNNLFKWTRENIEYCQLKYGIQLSQNGQGLDFDYHKALNIQQLTDHNWPNVQWLGFNDCGIDDYGWRLLVQKGTRIFPRLKILGLKSNNITRIRQGDLESFRSLRMVQFGTQDGCNPLSQQSKQYLKRYKQLNRHVKVKFRY